MSYLFNTLKRYGMKGGEILSLLLIRIELPYNSPIYAIKISVYLWFKHTHTHTNFI